MFFTGFGLDSNAWAKYLGEEEITLPLLRSTFVDLLFISRMSRSGGFVFVNTSLDSFHCCRFLRLFKVCVFRIFWQN